MESRAMLALLLVSLPLLQKSHAFSGGREVIDLLNKNPLLHKFTEEITTEFLKSIYNHLEENPGKGLTIFAFTNDARKKLPAGYFHSLTDHQKTELLLFHVVPEFLSFQSLYETQVPLSTLYRPYTLQVGVSQHGAVSLKAGHHVSVVTDSHKVLRVAIFSVDTVLIPPGFPWP